MPEPRRRRSRSRRPRREKSFATRLQKLIDKKSEFQKNPRRYLCEFSTFEAAFQYELSRLERLQDGCYYIRIGVGGISGTGEWEDYRDIYAGVSGKYSGVDIMVMATEFAKRKHLEICNFSTALFESDRFFESETYVKGVIAFRVGHPWTKYYTRQDFERRLAAGKKLVTDDDDDE